MIRTRERHQDKSLMVELFWFSKKVRKKSGHAQTHTYTLGAHARSTRCLCCQEALEQGYHTCEPSELWKLYAKISSFHPQRLPNLRYFIITTI